MIFENGKNILHYKEKRNVISKKSKLLYIIFFIYLLFYWVECLFSHVFNLKKTWKATLAFRILCPKRISKGNFYRIRIGSIRTLDLHFCDWECFIWRYECLITSRRRNIYDFVYSVAIFWWFSLSNQLQNGWKVVILFFFYKISGCSSIKRTRRLLLYFRSGTIDSF